MMATPVPSPFTSGEEDYKFHIEVPTVPLPRPLPGPIMPCAPLYHYVPCLVLDPKGETEASKG